LEQTFQLKLFYLKHLYPYECKRLKVRKLDESSSVLPKRRKFFDQGLDFSKLDLSTLRRYRVMYNLPLPANSSKQELADAVAFHFSLSDATIVNEKTIISQFCSTIRVVRPPGSGKGSQNSS